MWPFDSYIKLGKEWCVNPFSKKKGNDVIYNGNNHYPPPNPPSISNKPISAIEAYGLSFKNGNKAELELFDSAKDRLMKEIRRAATSTSTMRIRLDFYSPRIAEYVRGYALNLGYNVEFHNDKSLIISWNAEYDRYILSELNFDYIKNCRSGRSIDKHVMYKMEYVVKHILLMKEDLIDYTFIFDAIEAHVYNRVDYLLSNCNKIKHYQYEKDWYCFNSDEKFIVKIIIHNDIIIDKDYWRMVLKFVDYDEVKKSKIQLKKGENRDNESSC
jgi:hypothetical protein